MRALNLTDTSKFYRVMDSEYLEPPRRQGGAFYVEGNPNSVAAVSNHLAVEVDEPPLYREMREFAESQPPGPERNDMFDTLASMPPPSYRPVQMFASNLEQPSLNVMWGKEAAQGALGYLAGGPNRVLVEMTLGDVRKAGGEHVFFDVGAPVVNEESQPLILTVPHGAKVPVRIVS